MGHRFTYVVSPEEERENLTVEWFLRRHGYSRHIITGLKRMQRGMTKTQNVLMDGRDIGTVVLPDATVKIFLTAAPEARARRRWREYQQKGMEVAFEDVLADVKQRDYQDTHRAAAPLKQAEDAVLLDTSDLNFEQSLAAMKKIITEKVN